MSIIELPPHIRANMQRERAVDRKLAAAASVAKALVSLDPRLELWRAKERLPDPPRGVIPGYWHVVRRNDPPAPDTYMAITTDGIGAVTGGFRDVDHSVVEELRRSDMQGRHYSLPSDDYDAVEAAVKKERALRREQEGDEVASNFAAAKRVAGDGGLEKRLWGRDLKKAG